MLSPADLRRGLRSLPDFVDTYGFPGGLKRWSGIVYHRASGDISGRSVFEHEWDVCVVLDACRADELARFTGDYEWLGPVERFPSLASCTWRWVPRTIDRTPADVLQRTTYVTANPFPDELSEPDTFAAIDRVYSYAWDDEFGTVLPRPVTDRAVHHWREHDPDRLLVHYLQPHVPFLSEDAEPLSRANFSHDEESVRDAWDRVTRGELDRAVAVDRYRRTLARVLEDVDLLLSSIDAERVVVTADHGECFGEWGLYGHPQGVDLPCLTRVPWVETTAVDRGSYVPREYDSERADVSTGEQLRALGYTESAVETD